MPHIALVTPLALLAPLALLGTLLVAGLVVLVMRLRRLRMMQAEAARQAAAEAREQFGRDVHDLVSSRLWLASLRSELAYRLADDDSPLRPALADVVQSIRQASADIRNVTRSFRDVSLASELANARAVLHAYGTDCKVEATEAELGDEVSAVLAIMVREAVTNVLRHSRATLCTIEIVVRGGVATLTVANDGVDPSVRPGDGTGLDNLRNRAAALAGTVGTVLDPDGWFRLIAEIPRRGGDRR
ncbi:sensor histidine kinase [Microbispora bryophytorum]|uniref:sensor histidine kinase n=1 Tax=Microbispora bryophytorum TaxID=1460882 RepID=UPI00371C4A7A